MMASSRASSSFSMQSPLCCKLDARPKKRMPRRYALVVCRQSCYLRRLSLLGPRHACKLRSLFQRAFSGRRTRQKTVCLRSGSGSHKSKQAWSILGRMLGRHAQRHRRCALSWARFATACASPSTQCKRVSALWLTMTSCGGERIHSATRHHVTLQSIAASTRRSLSTSIACLQRRNGRDRRLQPSSLPVQPTTLEAARARWFPAPLRGGSRTVALSPPLLQMTSNQWSGCCQEMGLNCSVDL
mmetsp:Transcript_18142/g.38967  ORF Transcript_18142/g.38967 Transcript_18142/m.38967 type:complete len:243 (+) Transcript_18142:185-913(+)